MYMNAYVGYLIVIAYVFLIISDSFAGGIRFRWTIYWPNGHFSAISVDISANMVYVPKHE